MSTNMIIVLSIAGAAALIALFYISHSIEKQRRHKALLIASLSDHAFRLQRQIDMVPAAFINSEIRLLLLDQMKKRLQRLVQLSPENQKFSKRLSDVESQMSEIQQTPSAAGKPPPLATPEQANELRNGLQEMSKTIESMMQNKSLSVEDGNRHINSLRLSFLEANLNFYQQSAQSALKDEKFRLAVLNYEKAVGEMQKHNQNGAFTEQMALLNQKIAEINKIASNTPEVDANDETSELTQGMDQFIEDEDDWKKKYF